MIRDFSDRALNALGMRSGTFFIDAIYSHAEGKLYFVEAGARPGAGNMDRVLRHLHSYDAFRAFYFRQIPEEFWKYKGSDAEKTLQDELFMKPHDRSDDGSVYAVLAYPFQDPNRFSFQKVVTSIHPAGLIDYVEDFKTLKGCEFDETLARADAKKLKDRGIRAFRYPYEVGSKAISCYFEGPRDSVEKDLEAWTLKSIFRTKPARSFLNHFVPRSLFQAGGL